MGKLESIYKIWGLEEWITADDVALGVVVDSKVAAAVDGDTCSVEALDVAAGDVLDAEPADAAGVDDEREI